MPARRRACPLLLVLIGLALFAGPALAQRVALVVGASAYRHVPTLPNATNDATDLAGNLRELGFRVDLVLDPDRTDLERAVERFGGAARGAEAALFFYAGHAIEVGGRNWLIPVSAELRSPQQLRFQALELEAVTEQTQQAARVSLIILDACRDNPFRQRWPAASRSAAGRGLSRVSPATGTLVVFSTAPGAVAEDGRDRNSPFTAALLRHLPTPGLEVRPMLAEVRRSVREATRGAQVPWEESSLEGSFFFRPAATTPPPAAPPTVAQTSPDRDALAWQFVLGSRNPADFETFLQQFPDSIFAPFARNRLAELRAAPAPQVAALPTAPPPAAALPMPATDPTRTLNRAEAQEAQRLLTAMGFDTGGTDGGLGTRSRDALRAFAMATGRAETLAFTAETLEMLRAPAPPAERRAEALATLGRRALGAGDAAAAQRIAAASLRLRPDAEGHLLAGDAARALGDAAGARLAFQAAQRAGAVEAGARLAALAQAVPAAAPVPPPIAPPPSAPPLSQPGSLPIPPPAVPDGPVAFRCPPAGLRVTYADGAVRVSRGAAPGDPEICLAGNLRLLFNFHPLPVAEEAGLRAGMRAVWPVSPGRSTSHTFVASAWGDTTHFRQDWRVLRRDVVEVDGVRRAAMLIERRQEGMFGNRHLSVDTYWWDIATGVFLRRETSVVRGTSSAQPYQVVRIEPR